MVALSTFHIAGLKPKLKNSIIMVGPTAISCGGKQLLQRAVMNALLHETK
jgi:hypothetical protein